MRDPARGFQHHGKLAFFYTSEKYDELRQAENAEMTTLLAAQQEDVSEGDEEAAELAQEARVSFGDSVEFLAVVPPDARATPLDDASERARASLEAQTGGHTTRRARSQPQGATTKTEKTYYGLEDTQERRWVFHDFCKV